MIQKNAEEMSTLTKIQIKGRRYLSHHFQIMAMSCMVLVIILFGCGCWPLTLEFTRTIHSIKFWYHRRIICIHYQTTSQGKGRRHNCMHEWLQHELQASVTQTPVERKSQVRDFNKPNLNTPWSLCSSLHT